MRSGGYKKIVGDKITPTNISRVMACWSGCFGISCVQWVVCKYHGTPCPSSFQQQAFPPPAEHSVFHSLFFWPVLHICAEVSWSCWRPCSPPLGRAEVGQVRVVWGRWGHSKAVPWRSSHGGTTRSSVPGWCWGPGTAQMWPGVVCGFTDGLAVSADVQNQWLLGSSSLRKELAPGWPQGSIKPGSRKHHQLPCFA